MIGQAPAAPLIYLDHFAVRAAEKQRDRFATALKMSGGTWAMSWLNFLEFSETSEESAVSAEALIAACMPNLLFFEVESGAVIEKENRGLRGEYDGHPFVHHALANLYIMHPARISLDPLDPAGFVSAWRSPSLRASLREMSADAAKTTAQMFDEARAKRESDGTVRKNLDRRLRAPGVTVPPTRYVAAQTMKLMVKGSMSFEDGHNLRDSWHTVVPISYCDFVLLDRSWREMARQVQTKLGTDFKTAEILSTVDELIARMESVDSL